MTGQIARIEGKALTYFISSEGSKGINIFMDHIDKLYFVNLLRQQEIKKNLKFYAYVLLQNQYSLLVETYKNILSKSMHRINSDYVNYYNRRHKRKNKLFRDRYSCFIIDKKNYLADVSCYLHLLPKKNNMAKSLFQYKWSSLPGYINKEKREGWVDYDCILNMFYGTSYKASFDYQKHIKNILKEQIVSPFENLKGSIILGSKNFKNEVQKKHHSNKTHPQGNEDVIAKKIIKLATHPQHWFSLKVNKKKTDHTILSRNAAVYFIKKYTDLSNQQISTYFKSLKKSSISKMNQRFNLIKEKSQSIKTTSTSIEEEIKKLL